jgi:HEAT repeat protein
MTKYILSILSIAVILSMQACAPEYARRDEADIKISSEIQPDIDAISQYEFGESRAALVNVERLVLRGELSREEQKALERALIHLLRTDSTVEAGKFACRQLAQIGSEESIPALVSLLEDESLTEMARYALARIPGREVDAVLRDSVETVEGQSRIGLVNTLGERGNPGSVRLLRRILKSDDPHLSSAAAAALGNIGGKKAAKALLEEKERANGALAVALDEALVQCAEGFLQQGNPSKAAGISEQVMDSPASPPVRVAAFRILAEAQGEKSIPRIIQAMEGEDRNLINMAVVLVREMPGQDVTREFASQLNNLSGDKQVLLLNALAARGDQVAAPEIEKLVSSENKSVSVAALGALESLGGAEQVAPVAEVAADARGALRDAARSCLDSLKGEDVNQRMIDLLDQLSTDAQEELVRSLGQRRAWSAVDSLLSLAETGQRSVSREAFESLAILAQPELLPELIGLLRKDLSSRGRSEAEKTVVAVSRKDEDSGIGVDLLKESFEAETNPEYKASLLRTLGGIGGEEALLVCRAALDSDSPEVQDAAVRTLAAWNHIEAAGDLITLAKTLSNPVHKILALRGYLRLVGDFQGISDERRMELLSRALPLTRRADEKKMMLGTLSNVNSAAALDMTLEFMAEQGLETEAQLAALNIAKSISGAYPQKVRQLCEEILAEPAGEATSLKAQEILSLLLAFDDYLTGWQVCGPFAPEGKSNNELLEMPLGPEVPESEEVDWRIMPTLVDARQAWLIDLGELYPGNSRVAYLRTLVWSPESQKAQLEMGSDDSLRVWLNGGQVHNNPQIRGVHPDQDIVPVELQKGWNSLMMKVTQAGGGWGACARVRTPEGNKIEGLKFSVDTEKAERPFIVFPEE